MTGRLLGATILGFAIGAMVVLAEVAFRRAYLHVSYGPKDAFDLSLGAQPLAVGSDRSKCRIFTREAPAVAARYAFEGGRPTLTDFTGQTRPLQNGDTRRFGNVEITLHLQGAGAAIPTAPVQPRAPFAVQSAPIQPPIVAPIIAAPLPVAASWRLRGEPALNLPASGTLTLGRAADNDLIIADAGVSSRHARLQIAANSLTVMDLGSTNGTFVNSRKLETNAPTPLLIGDVVKFGVRAYLVEKG